MNNEQALEKRLSGNISDELKNELQYFIEMDLEEPLKISDAFDSVYDIAENNNERKLLKECRLILIELGGFAEAPVNTCVGADVRFQLNGKKYDWPHSGGWSSWLKKELKNN